MASKPEIPKPDTIEPQSPPETPLPGFPADEPMRQPPEIVPNQPDRDEPYKAPDEITPDHQEGKKEAAD